MGRFRNPLKPIACFLVAIPLHSASLAAGAEDAPSSARQIFDEVILIERIEPPLSLEGLSREDIAELVAANETLTEFFFRLNRGSGPSALDLLADEARSRYATPMDLFREHFDSEGLVSYRVYQYQLYRVGGRVVFGIFLRDTLEGVDMITQRQVTLTRTTNGEWRISSLR